MITSGTIGRVVTSLRSTYLLSSAAVAVRRPWCFDDHGCGGVVFDRRAWAASGVLRVLLYEVSATDGAVFAASALGLAAVTLAGYLVPATRAARVEPVTALRAE